MRSIPALAALWPESPVITSDRKMLHSQDDSQDDRCFQESGYTEEPPTAQEECLSLSPRKKHHEHQEITHCESEIISPSPHGIVGICGMKYIH